jgi:hypothetical protein
MTPGSSHRRRPPRIEEPLGIDQPRWRQLAYRQISGFIWGRSIEGMTGELAKERIDDDREERAWVAFAGRRETGVMPTLIDDEDVLV